MVFLCFQGVEKGCIFGINGLNSYEHDYLKIKLEETFKFIHSQKFKAYSVNEKLTR